MGEVRTRRLVASSLVMLLVLLVPVSAEEGDSVELEIDVVDANAKQWYGAGDVVLLRHIHPQQRWCDLHYRRSVLWNGHDRCQCRR